MFVSIHNPLGMWDAGWRPEVISLPALKSAVGTASVTLAGLRSEIFCQ